MMFPGLDIIELIFFHLDFCSKILIKKQLDKLIWENIHRKFFLEKVHIKRVSARQMVLTSDQTYSFQKVHDDKVVVYHGK